MTEGAIFTQCVYDVDNRYIDLTLNPTSDGRAFTLTMHDTSNDKVSDSEINLCLTKVDLKTVITRLTNILDKREKNE